MDKIELIGKAGMFLFDAVTLYTMFGAVIQILYTIYSTTLRPPFHDRVYKPGELDHIVGFSEKCKKFLYYILTRILNLLFYICAFGWLLWLRNIVKG